ncbi:MAG: hypothetical protein IPH84_09525 [Bacteroidales bacterium]|nr:hypothetical protein [Bacteroidales bacterium]
MGNATGSPTLKNESESNCNRICGNITQSSVCRHFSYIHCNPNQWRHNACLPVESEWRKCRRKFSTVPSNGNVVTCVMTSNATCVTGSPATSNSVTMTVNPTVTASVAISASANPVCAGTSVTFTAVPTNGGTTPSYQWKVNGVNAGTNSPNYSHTPANNDVVTCVMTSNASCVIGSPATSSGITMTVNPLVTASVSISASANPICAGLSYSSRPGARAFSSPSLRCVCGCGVVLWSPQSCFTPVSCSAGTSVTFTAVPTNEGTTPVYQWKVNGNNAGTNSATFNYVPANNDLVTCELTSNAVCVSGSPATSNSIVMSVDPVVTASVLISPSVNPVCAGTSVTFTAVPTNEGTTPVYQWKVNGNNAGTNSATFNYVPANNDLVTCELTSNAVCVSGSPATSNSIVMSVDPVVTASVLISPSVNPVCAGTSVTFTAVPTNEGTTPAYQWKVNGNNAGTNSATFNYVPANNDLVTCELTSNAVCVNGSPATSNSIVMSVDPLVTASVLISPSVNPVCAGTSVTFTAVPTNEGTTPVYQWKVNGNNAGTNSATFNYVPANNDLVTCELTSNAVCVSGSPATSNSIVMSVDPVVTASVLISPSVNPVCAGTSVTFTAVPTNEGTTPVYQWKVNGNNAGTNSATFNYVPANNDLVTCELTSNAVCVSGSPATSNSIVMSVDPVVTASVLISPSVNPVCAGFSYIHSSPHKCRHNSCLSMEGEWQQCRNQ